MDEVIKKKIEFEMSQIDEHISKSVGLIKKCKLHEPDYIELCAVGSILQSYYNGITPRQGKWHSELLSLMCVKNEKRSAVFSEKLKISLTDYMNFRHFFRHSYGYSIKWEKVSHLFLELENN